MNFCVEIWKIEIKLQLKHALFESELKIKVQILSNFTDQNLLIFLDQKYSN